MHYGDIVSPSNTIVEGAEGQPDATVHLALRLLGRGLDDGSPMRLLVGRLPEPLPVPLPFPDGIRLVGSQVLGPRATVVLDSDLPASQVLDFYRDRLPAEGWTAPEQRSMHNGGFASTMGAPLLFYCRGTRGPSLTIQATATTSGLH